MTHFPTLPDPDLTDAAIRKATGRGWEEWFAGLDAQGGTAAGRRALGEWMVGVEKCDIAWSPTIMVAYEAARGVCEKDGRGKGFCLCITKTIAAPVASVWGIWAERFPEWMGKGAKSMTEKDGFFSEPGGGRGKYLRVREKKDLRFMWEHPRHESPTQVDVTFAEKPGMQVVVTHDRVQRRRDADEIRAGWGAALDALKSLAEKEGER